MHLYYSVIFNHHYDDDHFYDDTDITMIFWQKLCRRQFANVHQFALNKNEQRANNCAVYGCQCVPSIVTGCWTEWVSIANGQPYTHTPAIAFTPRPTPFPPNLPHLRAETSRVFRNVCVIRYARMRAIVGRCRTVSARQRPCPPRACTIALARLSEQLRNSRQSCADRTQQAS